MPKILDITCSAPGKIILSGEHSVVYPGRPAIAASINRRCSCRLKEEGSGRSLIIRLDSLDASRTIELSDIIEVVKANTEISAISVEDLLAKYTIDADSPATKNALHVILFLLCSILHSSGADLNMGLALTVSSNLVLGAGSGSSAAFAVSVASSVYAFVQCLKRDDKERESIRTEILLAEEDYDRINSWAFEAERITHGNPSGLDNTICTHGGVVKLRRRDTGNEIVRMSFAYPLNVLLIDTGVSRSTSNLVAKVKALKLRHPSLFEHLLTALESVTESFWEILESLKGQEPSPEQKSEFEKLEDLIDINQGLLAGLGVSHPSLNQIIDICKHHDLHAKLTGAGGGGFAFALVPPNFDASRVDACVADLERAGFKVFRDLKLGESGVDVNFGG